MRTDIESVYDWIREPDNADTFTANDFVMWANERPTGEVLSAKFEIKTQADLIETQAAIIAELVGALENAKQYVPISTVECRGDKCREPWCASCFGEDHADKAIAEANQHVNDIQEALTKAKGSEQ